jgi:hypothetical protein
MVKRCVMTICFAVLATSTALAQERATLPTPPKPVGEGPSLEVTMKFIQDKLRDIARLNLMVSGTQTTDNRRLSQRRTLELSKVRANPMDCSIQYHYKYVVDDNPPIETADITTPLAAIENIQLEPFERSLTMTAASIGHPEFVFTSTQPQTLALVLNSKQKGDFVFFFQDDTVADRLAKALVHAVELCGGGSQPEPF